MRAVEFCLNNSSTDPFYRQNMQYFMCAMNCENGKVCPGKFSMVSPMSGYIMQYMTEINAGIPVYPNAGSWENQPDWFIKNLNLSRSHMAQLQKDKSHE